MHASRPPRTIFAPNAHTYSETRRVIRRVVFMMTSSIVGTACTLVQKWSCVVRLLLFVVKLRCMRRYLFNVSTGVQALEENKQRVKAQEYSN